jgi:hypothetical protein
MNVDADSVKSNNTYNVVSSSKAFRNYSKFMGFG